MWAQTSSLSGSLINSQDVCGTTRSRVLQAKMSSSRCFRVSRFVKLSVNNLGVIWRPISLFLLINRQVGLFFLDSKISKIWTFICSRSSARCLRQRENPLIKKCICHVRRSPVKKIDGGVIEQPTTVFREVEMNRVLADDVTSMVYYIYSNIQTINNK